ncbi:ABC transporter ATP-binding protein [Candidatus Saccharibacteria bacterium]|jgi:ABC-2 type transport system ATP-binding protein|nr:ABC transporter ATP-binding protein [Candidatus Saccharibacteria bacterium]
MDTVISLKKLTKKFGQVEAVKNVNLEIKTGTIVGFLGPNGAGKSTTMNILMGFISATSGEARLFDQRVSVSNIKPHFDIGFLSSGMVLDKSLTARQEIEYFGHLARGYNKRHVEKLAERLSLDLDAKISKMSTGNHQKVALILALMKQPDLLILDEPTNGLDPLVKAEFNKIILETKARGATVFISSHVLSEINELCDEFVFIKKGRIVAKMTKEELGKQSGEVMTIQLGKNRKKIIELLEKQGVQYEITANDLEGTFMQFYEEKEVSDA